MSDDVLTDDDLMLSEKNVNSLLDLAGFKVIKIWRLENPYWPRYEKYDEVRKKSPWWLVKVDADFPRKRGDLGFCGLIEMGWRKRVIEIDWSDTGAEVNVTDDNVTKGPTMVHAYSMEDALKYLKVLAKKTRG